jgi:hypothetical protein
MTKNDNIEQTVVIETTIELRIAKAIASVKRTSERVILITPMHD